MHYFQFEIKEWVSNTAHLSLEEEAAYLRLIFYYYDSERPIANSDLDKVFRRCRIESSLGCYILAEFFVCEADSHWVHKRCDAEIARYHAKKEQATKAGKASAERRSNIRSTTVQPIINHESLIINQKSKTIRTAPDGVSDSVWQDFVTLRKSRRAAITDTAIKGIVREAKKAGIPLEDAIRMCCERGWVGFKADWIKNAFPKVDKQLAAARSIFGDERNISENIIDV